MTVIAWDGKTLATDRQGTQSGRPRLVVKSRRLPSGIVLAGAGDHCECIMLMDWYVNGSKPSEWPKFQKPDDFNTLIVWVDGKIFEYHHQPQAALMLDEFGAWGEGAPFAIGAMAAGADAVAAVAIANEQSIYCGHGIDSYGPEGSEATDDKETAQKELD